MCKYHIITNMDWKLILDAELNKILIYVTKNTPFLRPIYIRQNIREFVDICLKKQISAKIIGLPPSTGTSAGAKNNNYIATAVTV